MKSPSLPSAKSEPQPRNAIDSDSSMLRGLRGWLTGPVKMKSYKGVSREAEEPEAAAAAAGEEADGIRLAETHPMLSSSFFPLFLGGFFNK